MYRDEVELLHSFARYHGTTASELVRGLIRRVLKNYQPY